jgi:hypothetical protein
VYVRTIRSANMIECHEIRIMELKIPRLAGCITRLLQI